MTIAPGTRLGRYEIRSQIGAGGMGEVYLAEDTRLHRKVALKVLPGEVASNQDRMRRFDQEAQAAAALNHPNIATIHEIGESDGVNFIAMEFIDGRTLHEEIRAQTGLPKLLRYLQHTAEGLAKAHVAGIVHRDLKPDNIMITRDGHAKILDFGLAKLIEQRPTPGGDSSEVATAIMSKHSTPGAIMGTVGYMSPEQAQGKTKEIDQRSDIFSFGCILFEAATGKKPFEGESVIKSLHKVVYEPAPPVTDLNPSAPPELQRILRRCLAKDPDERFQSIREVAIELKELRRDLDGPGIGPRVPPPQKFEVTPSDGNASSVQAVLPDGGTPGTHQSSSVEYVVTGIKRHKLVAGIILAILTVAAVAFFFYRNRPPALTDKDTILLTDFTNATGDAVFDGTLRQALAAHLRQSPFLNLFSDDRVRETLRLMNRSPDERVTPPIGREICQRQGLKAMLTGSIASLGRNYLINLEAINAQTGEVLASEQAEAEGKEQVVRSLGEAATRLREKLGETLRSIQKFDAPIDQVTTSSLEALKAYSLGAEQNLKGEFLAAIPLLKHAIELDPNFASAYSSLALTYARTGQPGLAGEAARKAFELRERVSEREKLLIADQYYSKETGELNKAIEALELGLQTYPRDAEAHHNLGFRYFAIGQDEKAVKEYLEALRLNPSLGITRSTLSTSFMRLNRFEEARVMGEQAIAQGFDNGTRNNFFNIAFINGDTGAMKQQVDWASARPGEYMHLNWQAGAAAFAGQLQKALELSNRAAELAEQRNLQEGAGDIVSTNAEWAAVLGQCQQSREDLARAAALPRTKPSYFRAGLAVALCGDASQAQLLNGEAVKRYPKNMLVNEVYLPLIRAAMEIRRSDHTQAIQILQAGSRYESISFYYQNYLRGQAYLGNRNGAEASREFQTILDHRGWSPLSPLYPLAYLGLARAAMMQGDTTKARKAYQDFFAIWKDADSDIPVLIEAKTEYAKLK
jgi:serine/threonine protein kinase/tetratricopeptide (TPR) repeat protein